VTSDACRPLIRGTTKLTYRAAGKDLELPENGTAAPVKCSVWILFGQVLKTKSRLEPLVFVGNGVEHRFDPFFPGCDLLSDFRAGVCRLTVQRVSNPPVNTRIQIDRHTIISATSIRKRPKAFVFFQKTKHLAI
jgi:hypothetical protein